MQGGAGGWGFGGLFSRGRVNSLSEREAFSMSHAGQGSWSLDVPGLGDKFKQSVGGNGRLGEGGLRLDPGRGKII